MKRIFTTLLAVSAISTIAVAEPTTVLFHESFDNLQGQGGNDGYFDNDADAGQLRFCTESSSEARQRAYLDEITVSAEPAGVNDIATVAESAAPKGVYTLTGVKIAPERMTRGFYIIDGKKVIK